MGEFKLIYPEANVSGHRAALYIYEEEHMAAEYRSMEDIRKDADMEYHVIWRDYSGNNHHEKVIANDHECALENVVERSECFEVITILKGEILVLWQA